MPDEIYEAHEVLGHDEYVEFTCVIEERAALDSQIKELTAGKKHLTETLVELMADTGCPKIRTPSWNVTISAPSIRKTLDREKLILAGVTVEQLAQGVVEKRVAGSLRVTKRKEGHVNTKI